MSFSGQIYPEETVGYIRVASNTGRHPVEPVSIGEFRIGRGANCHLRLGSPDIAEVEAVLSVERDVVLLQSVDTGSSVLVNGSPATECRLTDGDLLEVGEHRLLFRFVATQSRITLDEEAFAVADAQDNKAAALEQIVDRLGEQIELVEELAHTPEHGLAELMKAVTNNVPAPRNTATAAKETAELLQVKMLIQKHHEASRIRLESLTQVLDNVVRQQKLIADTLEVMSERIQGLSTDSGFTQRRASA